jgi:hypothetical protein
MRMGIGDIDLPEQERMRGIWGGKRPTYDELERDLAALRDEKLDLARQLEAVSNINREVEITLNGVSRELAEYIERVKPLDELLEKHPAPLLSEFDTYICDSLDCDIKLNKIAVAINAFASHAPAQSGEGGA